MVVQHILIRHIFLNAAKCLRSTFICFPLFSSSSSSPSHWSCRSVYFLKYNMSAVLGSVLQSFLTGGFSLSSFYLLSCSLPWDILAKPRTKGSLETVWVLNSYCDVALVGDCMASPSLADDGFGSWGSSILKWHFFLKAPLSFPDLYILNLLI